jgi:hypothetical protein
MRPGLVTASAAATLTLTGCAAIAGGSKGDVLPGDLHRVSPSPPKGTLMRIIAMAALIALTLTGCGNAIPSAPATPPAAPTLPAEVPSTSASPEVSVAPTPAQSPVRLIKIPAVVGKNHQLAQDTMQAAGLYDLREEDATGQGRLLIWDRNWVVARQTPSAGRRVRPDTVVALFSKKIGE